MKRYRAIAEFYDAEYAGKQMLERDVPFFLRHLPKKPQDVLELAVGTARAAIPIAQAGHRVVGVDCDADMLDIGRRKAKSVGLKESELLLVHGDALKLKLDQTFDTACIFFNTFLNFITLAEQDQVLAGVVRHLRPGGTFWMDIFHPNLELLAQSESNDMDPSVFYVPALDRTVYRVADIRRDPATQTQRIVFRYKWFDDHGREQHEERKFKLTFMFPRELQLLIERHGLRLETLWGDYDGSKLNADSPRMIAQCRKPRAAK